jgi:hypothetical protein
MLFKGILLRLARTKQSLADNKKASKMLAFYSYSQT